MNDQNSAKKTTRYETLVLKMFPVGCSQPGLTWLRTNVAKLLENEVTTALIKQREEAFPDLQKSRQEVDEIKRLYAKKDEDLRSSYLAKQEQLNSHELKLKELERTLKAKENKLNILTKAFKRYLDWLDGEGEVDENSKRFNELREAHRKYEEET